MVHTLVDNDGKIKRFYSVKGVMKYLIKLNGLNNPEEINKPICDKTDIYMGLKNHNIEWFFSK
jgi:hypothetical protein